ncbi:YadA-like C-terminal region [Desulfomicrobium apsheronum]|uniref:YadA-like C-terminal region n=1 Tax=Desulfomicrobium apsheronum TaxID=52560 RepID=A0A1I3VZC6_9BACT|nr:YadA C-terminal domain-containing protein [Desulfomicrobium apsheronum]SFK00303.1 YadA-like C-terminal region [Desulfomicrobium apsheronum]
MQVFMKKRVRFFFVTFLLLIFVLVGNAYAADTDYTFPNITNPGSISGVESLSVDGTTTLTGETKINVSGTATTTIGNQSSAVNILGGTNTIGNVGSSVNTLNGSTNTLNATAQNAITGGTGNAITSVTGNNAITAVTGNNVMSALGVNGENRLEANAATGTNSIEAKRNNIGVGTTNSTNTIGNTFAGTTVDLKGGNSHVAVQQGSASIGSGTNGLTTTSTASTLGTDAATLNTQLNGVGDEASRANLAGASYVNRLEGDTLINGNTFINGRLVYTSNTVATTSVNSGTSILPSAGKTSGHMTIVNKDQIAPHAVVDGNGRIAIANGPATEASSAMTLTNGMGNTHGMVITERKTVISGGTQSTSLTLDDRGATFGKSSNGDPVRVTGVADGKSRWDAVNYGQLNRGVAIAASMATIPQVEQDKTFSLGAGTGYYGDETGIAIGGSVRLSPNTVMKAAASFSPTEFDNAAFSAGFAYSW